VYLTLTTFDLAAWKCKAIAVMARQEDLTTKGAFSHAFEQLRQIFQT
jgi:hypothetical protein